MQRAPINQFGFPANWKKRALLAGILVGYSLMIFSLSSLTNLDLPQPFFENQDKLEHLVAYGFMAIMAWLALRQWTLLRHCWLWAWVYAVGYGITDEWHQLFVPGRYGDLLDLLADALGAALAIALVELYRARREARLAWVLPRFMRLSWS
ncbi:MAG: VanZ family protein [Magnetococcales bacterium]|nr:VanZ family protein [Magnetococcales bacterium]NGZ06754.1 VanZ family protein [Magnetococcales bacterium]